MPSKGWWLAEIEIPSDRAEEFAGILSGRYNTGVEVGKDRVRIYFDGSNTEERWRSDLERVWASIRKYWKLSAEPKITFSFCEDRDWNALWKKGFRPIRVGRRWVIAPSWEKLRIHPGDRLIRVDPGQAFGTGHHETTRLCLEWLEKHALSDRPHGSPLSLLDVGTGSGILAIAGFLLGCSPVVGVDNDPVAVETARKNLHINGMTSKVWIVCGTVHCIAGHFHRVVANIQANPLMEMASVLARKMHPCGKLALSGILKEQVAAVVAEYEAQGLRMTKRMRDGEWALLEFDQR